MKKLSILFVLSLSILFYIFTGCKTVPAENQVKQLDLLDNNSSFYMAIPKTADKALINRIVMNNIQGITESQAEMIADKVEVIYCGLNRSKNHTEIQSSIKGSIPSGIVSKALTKKNGWESQPLNAESNTRYTLYSSKKVDVSFPDKSTVCLGRGVKDMVYQYDLIKNTEETGIENKFSPLDEQLYNYLEGAENEIRFFANKPQSFLTILAGTQLDLKLIDVCGNFVSDPKHQDQYLLNLQFRFRNETFMKAGKSVLTLAFGLADSQSVVIGNSELHINGIKLKKEQLYKLLVL